jgi:predicted CoA-substrate-specific enzyme activase
MITIGIDIGSRNTKLVLYNPSNRSILFSAWVATEVNPLQSVQYLLNQAKDVYGLELPKAIACTGYGRKLWKESSKIFSEITCHTAGVRYYIPEVQTIIDVGGQDAKIISLTPEGKIKDFVMNDKCAAGTGRFLEMIANRLEVSLDELSELAQQSKNPLTISSTCIVFAESEIIGMIAQNTAPADIAYAAHISIAKRIITQLSALDFAPPIVFTGGVAQNRDLVQCLGGLLNTPIITPPNPEITGALGAAILLSQMEEFS